MMYGQQHYLEATRLTDGQLLVVCSDKEGKGEAYGERWQIETLFGSLKSKGFNLEDAHMTAPAKIDKLMSVLAIGFVLSCRAGEAEDKRRPIKVKKHGRSAQSLFQAKESYVVVRNGELFIFGLDWSSTRCRSRPWGSSATGVQVRGLLGRLLALPLGAFSRLTAPFPAGS